MRNLLKIMSAKLTLKILIFLFTAGLLVSYWFLPLTPLEFGAKYNNSNFNPSNESSGMQFYNNMRFPDRRVSYRIERCPLQKVNEMEQAFEILENLTPLEFYPVEQGEQIKVMCNSSNKVEGGLFIAGEGGPTNITKSGKFNAILSGKILLIRESKCARPNVALHELLHVLGFNHSTNPRNVMYPIVRCDQTIGKDVVQLLNKLYAIESLPDLGFENISAVIEGRYFSANISLRNIGLAKSEKANLKIYLDNESFKEIEIPELDIGHGRKIVLKNFYVRKFKVSEIKFTLEHLKEELNKTNNEAILRSEVN